MKGGSNGNDMRPGRTDWACNEPSLQAAAEIAGLGGSTSPERHYGVIGVKRSQAHFTE